MKSWLPGLTAVLVLAFAGPAHGQYMYLDCNGDGVSTTADVLNAVGVGTTVDVWLVTNENANGSPATCNSGDPPPEGFTDTMTINSYGVALQANNGTVAYSNFINQLADTPTALAPFLSDATHMGVGRGGGTINPAGLYKLMTVTITAVSGSPTISIIPDSPLGVGADIAFTNFGTSCSGNDFDNTYKIIGTTFGAGDWTDVQGTYVSTPVTQTTWGKIKNMYR